MKKIESVEELAAIYGQPKPASLNKVADRLTRTYREWIAQARFVVLSTVGPDGTDASPRGDEDPVVAILNDRTLAMPDWRGNNRCDSLQNIVMDGRTSLMFMVPGSSNVIRINGLAQVVVDEDLIQKFEKNGARPRSVIVFDVGEVYFQCARAINRSGIWSGDDQSQSLPTPGQILSDVIKGDFDGASYDAEWPKKESESLW